MTAADLTTSFAYLRNYIGRDDWVRPEGEKCDHCEALDHLDRIEQNIILTREEAEEVRDHPGWAKLERIAGDAEEVTPPTNHA